MSRWKYEVILHSKTDGKSTRHVLCLTTSAFTLLLWYFTGSALNIRPAFIVRTTRYGLMSRDSLISLATTEMFPFLY